MRGETGGWMDRGCGTVCRVPRAVCNESVPSRHVTSHSISLRFVSFLLFYAPLATLCASAARKPSAKCSVPAARTEFCARSSSATWSVVAMSLPRAFADSTPNPQLRSRRITGRARLRALRLISRSRRCRHALRETTVASPRALFRDRSSSASLSAPGKRRAASRTLPVSRSLQWRSRRERSPLLGWSGVDACS